MAQYPVLGRVGVLPYTLVTQRLIACTQVPL